MEDVRLREVAGQCAPLHGLLTQESVSRQVEVDVVLVRTPLLRPEDEQTGVDAHAAKRVDVCPAGAGQVDREVEDAGVDRWGHSATIRSAAVPAALKRRLYRAVRDVRHPRRAVERRQIREEVARFLGGRAALVRYEREVRDSGLVDHLLRTAGDHYAAVTAAGHSLGAIGYAEGTFLYAVLRTVRPQVVVETGVANGFSTAFSLLALRANGEGHLHSIDLPREVGREYEPGTFYEGEGRAGIPPGFESGWLIPPELKDTEGYYTAVSKNTLVFMSNSKLLKEKHLKAPTSWMDLLDPGYKGQIQTADARTSGTALTP